ncbi:hypothetical protein JCM8547_002582 [Rhodosporidiobolus lusitaniae]
MHDDFNQRPSEELQQAQQEESSASSGASVPKSDSSPSSSSSCPLPAVNAALPPSTAFHTSATPSPRKASHELPNELLHFIFVLAATPATPPPHGGTVRAWYSYELAAPFSLVCRAWRGEAQAVLFSSVALVGHRAAKLFVRTAQSSTSTHLVQKTSSLVLAVEREAESARTDTHNQKATTELLTTALEACPSAVHLHLRPLSHDVRARLLPAIFSPARGVRTIVLSPRVLTSLPWSGGLWTAEDATEPVTSLENLEITTFVVPVPAGRTISPSFPPLALRRIQVHHDYPMVILSEALRKSPHLEFIDLYFEALKPLEDTVETLRVSASSVKEMRYICNPTQTELDYLRSPDLATSSPPLFDRLLPYYTSLTSLHVTASDISPPALLSLPSSLRKLHVKALSVHSSFTCASLLDVLRSSSFSFPEAFQTLIVTDAPESWEGSEAGHGGAEEVKRLLEQRGVRFVFRLDYEEEESTNGTFGGSSGTNSAGMRSRPSSAGSSRSVGRDEEGEQELVGTSSR